MSLLWMGCLSLIFPFAERFLRPCGGKRAELERRLTPHEITARASRDYGSLPTRLRLVITLLLMMIVGVGNMWGQIIPTTDTNGDNVIDETERKYYLLQNVGNTGVKAFYAMPYDNIDGDEIRITTTNVPNSDMRFYFMNVDNEAGYYYIIHCSGKYLYAKGIANDNGGARLKALSTQPTEIDRYKFRIELNGGSYYIINKSLGDTAPLCKRGGNAFFDNKSGEDNYYFLKLNTWTPRDNFFLWNFIAISETSPLVWTPPFTPSTEESRSYYNIQSRNSTSHYISINNSNNVTTTTTNNNNRVWYFEEVPVGENGSDEYITYYYIVHALTGKYMCFDGNPATSSDQNDAASIQIKTESNEQKCQFIVTRSGENANPEYFNIIPKALKSYYWNSQCIALKNTTSGSHVYTKSDRINDNKNTARWIFGSPIEYTNVCATPTISCTNTGVVTIESTTDEPIIYYTTDGTTIPDPENAGEGKPTKVYYPTNKPTISATTTIKAIATKDGVTRSLVATETFTKVATPSVINNGTQIVISCDTENATLSYSTDGGMTYTDYTAPLVASSYLGQTITAKATKTGWVDSDTYSLHVDATCNMPTFTLNYQTGAVTIESTTSGATIYYTLDETDPDDHSTLYSSLTLTEAKTVRAIAYKEGFSPSAIASVTYSQVPTPTIQSNGSNAISITCATDGAEIHYLVGGNNPDYNSTQYDGTPLTSNVSNKVIKAIAFKTGMVPSSVGENTVMLQCNKPVITKGTSKITISCDFPASGYTIYYSDDGSEPTTPYPTGGITITNYGFTVRAKAVATDYTDSEETSRLIMQNPEGSGTEGDPYLIHAGEFAKFVAKADEEPGAFFKLVDNIEATNDEISTPFTGTFEVSSDNSGNFYKINGLSHALFNTINGGTVKNVVLDGVTISTGTNVGAICNEAEGNTKIYNCGVLSGSVNGSGYVGGLVGHIKSGSSVRVVNCYNYADVSSTGEYAAGIVGKNEGTIANNKTVGNVRIALCMMYGSVSGATHRSPVYGGTTHVSNLQNFTEYNYYLYSNERDADGNIVKKINYTSGDYNDQLAIEKDDYLTRFPFYRHILNTHRKLAAFFLFGAVDATSVTSISSDQVEEIGHWAVKKGDDAHKYPIIEPWEKNTKTTPYYNSSTDNNYTPPTTTEDYAGKLLTDMGNDGNYKGYLKVTVKMSSDHTLYLPITDMDTLRYDYNYGKVILPFANEYEVNTDYTRICTGWKITNVDGITSSSVSNYNFADRDNKQKDIYDSNNPYIFAQGGYYIVPKGVKAIEITPNYATAYYLSDASYDVGLDTSYGGETPLGGTVPNGANAFHGQTVYTSLSSALGAMSTTNNPHQQAIVLVGNYHFDGASLTDSKAFTFMSIDEDCNQEPDYGFYMYNKQDRPTAPAMRFDFLPVIPVGWAAHVAGSGGFKGVPIWKVRGWFEITETCVFYTDQCEIDSENFKETNNGKGNNPWVINSGYFVQIVRTNKNSTGCNRVSYIKMGGNVYVKEFYPGAHSEVSGKITKIVPVNVTGGEIKECFMTGYNSKCSAEGENIQFWCAGGKIHKFLGAYMDKPTSATVNVTANIDHALITRFYGGGTSAEASITGDIEVTITNSKVDFYCGGPEFSSLTAKPTVTTIASNTIFGQYYGAGFGGTSITYNLSKQESGYAIGSDKVTFPISFSSYYKRLQNLTVGGKSLGTCYKLEYIHHSRQQQLVARFFTGYAEFSLATTGNVSNTLDGCTIKSDFYGAGCQGKVDGTVSSTLTNCKVDGSVYGGGYKATANEVKVYTTTQPEYSIYDKETAIFSEFGTVAPETYTWGSGTAGTVDQGSKVLYTDAPMGQLGVVTNDITLTIKGKKSDATYTVKNNVFGGGNESPSEKKATVVIEDYVDGNNNASGTIVQGSVYGGGNEAPIGTDSKVTLKGSTNVQGNVFGGGNMGVVNGSATVEIKAN